jgi:hypothetical protein
MRCGIRCREAAQKQQGREPLVPLALAYTRFVAIQA